MHIADLNAEVRSLCDADTSSYTAADLLRRVNNALEELVSTLINADGTWQYDDTNHTDLPIGTGNLVAGQSSYSFASEFLDVETVKVMDAGGTYRLVQPLDPKEMTVSIEEYFGTSTGMPTHYDKQGDTIKLYPAPSTSAVTLTAGLKVHFKRTAALFTTAEVNAGTKEPGIASPYHQLIAYMAALPYCMAYKKDRVPLYEKKTVELKADMVRFYSRREKDKRKVMSMKPIRFH